ncbi:unnamed protein product [Staurois parvus]|uniref:Uncharacterized protein n=1 Tax=Staurois parvus TaxID=386267 RepID=A0ABN9F5W5_9NEOB|nr:unnamed protein product [Staurois parvus]
MCHFRVSSHCCQVHTDSWPPACVWPSIEAASASPLCHGPLYRLLLLLPGPECVMGPCTASHCC